MFFMLDYHPDWNWVLGISKNPIKYLVSVESMFTLTGLDNSDVLGGVFTDIDSRPTCCNLYPGFVLYKKDAFDSQSMFDTNLHNVGDPVFRPTTTTKNK